MHIELNYPSVAEAFAKVRDMLTISDLGHSVKAVIDIDRNSPFDGSYIHVKDSSEPIKLTSEPIKKKDIEVGL